MANTIKINSGSAKMIAHQGLSGLETGNTNQAFIAAGNREKYFGIETDVHRTLDGRYVTIHDSNTAGVSDASMDVEKSSFDALRSICLRDKTGLKDRADIRVPSLEEYISICKKYEKVSVLELKTPLADEHVREIIDIIDGLGHLQDTIFISFHRVDVIAVRKFLPDQKVQFLTTEWNDDVKKFVLENRVDLDISYPTRTKETVEEIKSLGIELNIWTVDDKALAEEFISWGADYITTNILE